MRIKHFFFLLLFSLTNIQAYAAARIQHWQSSQGGQVYFVASPGLPMVDIRLVFDAGSARDGKHQGIASLTASLLETGAGQWSADQLAQRFDDVGAKFHYATNRDTSSISLRTLTQADLFTQAVTTFQHIISQPRFAAQDFQRIKEQTLIGLKQQQERPGYIAKKAFYQSLYAQHPYAHLKAGDPESVSAIQLTDIQKFYQQYYVSNNAVLVIVGDLTETQVKETAEALFSSLRTGEKAAKLPQASLPVKGKKQHIAFSSTQTHVLAGLPILSRKDADYFPLYVGNHILGGSGLVSKLFGEIREKRGLAYSAYSYFSPLAVQGPFTLGLQTQNKQRTIAIDVMQQTLGDFITQGPTQAELTAAKKNITGGFVLRFDNNKKLLNYVAMIAFYQLPLDYLQTFQDKVSQVTLEEIKSAFHRRVKTDLLQIISVGGE
ncbi:MAG: insulinase family protein [Methyloprofundus sp.]|nr:insulinase family protein [Methyloprofundus sp.]